MQLSTEQIQQRLFTRTEELPEGMERIGLKEVHLNKSPVLAPAATLTPDQAERWSWSGDTLRSHLAKLKAGLQGSDLIQKLHQVYNDRNFEPHKDVDQQLYGGFWSGRDKQVMEQVHACPKGSVGGVESTISGSSWC